MPERTETRIEDHREEAEAIIRQGETVIRLGNVSVLWTVLS